MSKFKRTLMDEWPKINEYTPVEVVKETHQRIWQYVIDFGEKPITPYLSNCAACNGSESCIECRIDWPEGKRCDSYDGLYYSWLFAKRLCKKDEARHFAELIRDVKFKEDI